jgi:hypothetical protein
MFYRNATKKLNSALAVFVQAQKEAVEAAEIADDQIGSNSTKISVLYDENVQLTGVKTQAASLAKAIGQLLG